VARERPIPKGPGVTADCVTDFAYRNGRRSRPCKSRAPFTLPNRVIRPSLLCNTDRLRARAYAIAKSKRTGPPRPAIHVVLTRDSCRSAYRTHKEATSYNQHAEPDDRFRRTVIRQEDLLKLARNLLSASNFQRQKNTRVCRLQLRKLKSSREKFNLTIISDVTTQFFVTIQNKFDFKHQIPILFILRINCLG